MIVPKQEVRKTSTTVKSVRNFYESDVVIATFNNGFAGRWHTQVATEDRSRPNSVQHVCELGQISESHSVLDFGSGVGITSCDVAHISGCSVRGLNISPKQVRLASSYADQSGMSARVSFDCYEGTHFPYPSMSFDRVTFFESPCHVPHKELLFSEIFRVLKPGGVCVGQDWVLTTDDIEPVDYRKFIYPIESTCEVCLISFDEFERRLRDAGFNDVATYDANALDSSLEESFATPSTEPIELDGCKSDEERLRLGNVALSNAFHRDLFSIGFIHGRKPPNGD